MSRIVPVRKVSNIEQFLPVRSAYLEGALARAQGGGCQHRRAEAAEPWIDD
jgi:hypothetical protein